MLFHFKDGALLSRHRFVSCVGEALKVAGVDCKSYAGHSSQQVWCGLAPAMIKTLGRWESSAYLLYRERSWQGSRKC